MYASLAFSVLVFIVMGVSLYQFKYKYLFLDQEYKVLLTNIKDHEESIHVLSAEWAHLNHPKNLETLARKHLNMMPGSLHVNPISPPVPAKSLPEEGGVVPKVPAYKALDHFFNSPT